MITVENLRKRYDGNPILDGLSFTVKDGEIYDLLGPNGSGESTTMKILSGILKPDEGNVIIEGVNASENQLKVKEIVGFVPESPTLYESPTPAELFDFIGKVRKIPRGLLEERVNAFVKAFGIEEYLDQFIGTLSFGTKQKVSIIAALLHDPKVLVLDEAMNGLDVKSARIFRELLLEYKRKGKSIVFSTHVLQLAEIICDRIGVIHRGKIVAEGTVEELKKRLEKKSLEDVFLKITESREEVLEIVKALK